MRGPRRNPTPTPTPATLADRAAATRATRTPRPHWSARTSTWTTSTAPARKARHPRSYAFRATTTPPPTPATPAGPAAAHPSSSTTETQQRRAPPRTNRGRSHNSPLRASRDHIESLMFTARWSRWGLVALLSLGLTACDSPGSEYKTPRDVVLASRIFKAEPLAEPLHTSCPSEARHCNALMDRLSNSPFHEVVAQELG